jgi:hypothetical protein
VVDVAMPEAKTALVPPGAEVASGKCDDLVENAEDGNNQVLPSGGRSGYIYTYVDPEGSTVEPPPGNYGGIFEPSAGGTQGSALALRFHGTLVEAGIVYGGLGLNLLDPKGPYDASAHGGIAFWARSGKGPGHVQLKVPDENTDPDGGKCSNCYNDFQKRFDLDETWRRYVVRFDELAQEPDWGSPRPEALTRHGVYSLQFQVAEPGPYDIWLDDIAFCAR